MTIYSGYIPPNTEMYPGDYTTSPSGLFYGALDTGGNFWVVWGSNPKLAPIPAASSNYYSQGYQVLTANGTNQGGYFVHMQTDGNFVSYTSATGKDVGPITPVAATASNQIPANPPYYAQINDKGDFQIYQGANGPTGGTAIYGLLDNDPPGTLTGIQIKHLTYDFNNVTNFQTQSVAEGSVINTNPGSLVDQGVAQLNISYTLSESFSFSVANTTGLNTSVGFQVGVPGIGQASTSVTVVDTTTVTNGQSDTTSKTVTLIAGSRPEVPAHSSVITYITGEMGTYDVPFTWDGVETFSDGTNSYSARVEGTGTFSGGSTGNFRTVTYLCESINNCTNPPPSLIESGPALIFAPEPGFLLPVALLMTGIARRFRRRR